jgi:site-specific DNA-methyltransferase (adenine-specific)
MLKLNEVYQGDCLEALKDIEDNSIGSIVTDPPYELGFMGKKWDNSGIAYNVDMWKECLRVLKPGGHLLSFGGTRTYHRMACAIEDAGFEVRDMIEWVYGSGFPKSLNIGKAVDKLQGNEREVKKHHIQSQTNPEIHAGGSVHITMPNNWEVTKGTSEWEGRGTALKPAHEPICMARKPLAEKTVAENCLKYGTGGINIDGCRVGVADSEKIKQGGHTRKGNVVGDNRTSIASGQFGDGAFVAGTDLTKGRFPANLIHDNSEEVRECFPETKSQGHWSKTKTTGFGEFGNGSSEYLGVGEKDKEGGNASRFFKSIIYQAKASKSERNKGCEGLEEKIQNNTETNSRTFNDRCLTCKKKFVGSDNTICHCPPELKITDKTIYTNKNNHPTVKPIALMEYLINMVTPKNGIVLDPFAGSGSTLVAAKKLGYNYIGIEKESEYVEIINKRLCQNTTN